MQLLATGVMAEPKQMLENAVCNLCEDIEKICHDKYNVITKSTIADSTNKTLIIGNLTIEIKLNSKEIETFSVKEAATKAVTAKKKSERNKRRDKERMKKFIEEKNNKNSNSDIDLKEFCRLISTSIDSLKESMKVSQDNLLKSTPHKKIIEDSNGFPIWDPGEEVTLNDSNITVTENSLCEAMKDEYFDELQYFTQSTLRQHSVLENNVVLGGLRDFSQDNSGDKNHWPLQSGHNGGEGNFAHSGQEWPKEGV